LTQAKIPAVEHLISIKKSREQPVGLNPSRLFACLEQASQPKVRACLA
jgi:hypothetical protein